jgi:hypothetical protein
MFAQRSKKHRFGSSKFLTIDGRNLVGPWLIEVGESESEYKSGFKGQKNIGFGNSNFLTIDGRNLVGP